MKPADVSDEHYAAFRAEVEANGRLIAAAPDMQEALRPFAAARANSGSQLTVADFDGALAAYAKATEEGSRSGRASTGRARPQAEDTTALNDLRLRAETAEARLAQAVEALKPLADRAVQHDDKPRGGPYGSKDSYRVDVRLGDLRRARAVIFAHSQDTSPLAAMAEKLREKARRETEDQARTITSSSDHSAVAAEGEGSEP